MNEGVPTIRAVIGEVDDLGHARHLFRSYAEEFAGSIAESLCFQGFDAEVAGLPGRYAPPSGRLLLAMDGGIPLGCVAMRDLGGGDCEMKRLYVAPEGRGRGVGRRLVGEILRRGRTPGIPSHGAGHAARDGRPAIALYRSFGFVEVGPYWANPVERTIYMERGLDVGDAMGKVSLAEVVQADMAAYFEHLAARIERLARSLSEEQLWVNPFGFGNSVGRIVAHLTGSLTTTSGRGRRDGVRAGSGRRVRRPVTPRRRGVAGPLPGGHADGGGHAPLAGRGGPDDAGGGLRRAGAGPLRAVPGLRRPRQQPPGPDRLPRPGPRPPARREGLVSGDSDRPRRSIEAGPIAGLRTTAVALPR